MEPVIQPKPLPIVVQIPDGICPGRFITVYGNIPIRASRFHIRLQCGPSRAEKEDIAMCITFCLEQHRARFCVNSFKDKQWGQPEGTVLLEKPNKKPKDLVEQSESKMKVVPLSRGGQKCAFVIECHQDCYSIYVKAVHVHEYSHRVDYKLVTCLGLLEDFHVVRAGVTGGEGVESWLIHGDGGADVKWDKKWILQLTVKNFDSMVKKSPEPWMVLVYISTCAYQRVWEKAAQEFHGRVNFGAINAFTNLDLVCNLFVFQCPTVLFYPTGVKTSGMVYLGEYTDKSLVSWCQFQLSRKTGACPTDSTSPPPVRILPLVTQEWCWLEKAPHLEKSSSVRTNTSDPDQQSDVPVTVFKVVSKTASISSTSLSVDSRPGPSKSRSEQGLLKKKESSVTFKDLPPDTKNYKYILNREDQHNNVHKSEWKKQVHEKMLKVSKEAARSHQRCGICRCKIL